MHGQINVKTVDCIWNVMAHAQKPDFGFRRNGRVHLNLRGRQFSRLLAAEVCASAVVMLDRTCSEVVWRVLTTHSIRQFPLHFRFRASPCTITFQLDSISGCMILIMKGCLLETNVHIYETIRLQYASVFWVTTVGVSNIFLKLSGLLHYFKSFSFVSEILSSLCNEFLKANVSAILYLMNYEKYGRSTASAQYFLQLAGYLGIPVIAWNADNSGLERVRCECRLTYYYMWLLSVRWQ